MVSVLTEGAFCSALPLLARSWGLPGEAVNNTIAGGFGRNTRAYWHHSLPSFDSIPVVLGSPRPSPAEVRDFSRHGIDKAVKKLSTIVESLEERLDQMESRDSGPSASPGPKRETR